MNLLVTTLGGEYNIYQLSWLLNMADSYISLKVMTLIKSGIFKSVGKFQNEYCRPLVIKHGRQGLTEFIFL